MLYDKVYMRFNKDKEYIYRKDTFIKKDIWFNDIGKTFIDFLAKSDEIIKIIKSEFNRRYKDNKLKDARYIHIGVKFELEKISPFFGYFDYDKYISEYIKKLRDENNAEIKDCLEEIKAIESDIEYYKSKEYYEDLLKDKISSYHDYGSDKSKKAFYYINKAEENTNRTIKKFIKQYGYRPSYKSWKKICYSDENYIKGKNIIKEIEEDVYNKNKEEIEEAINKNVRKRVKENREFLQFYRKCLKDAFKDSEETLEEIFNEHINKIQFWIDFSKYVLIAFYDISSEKYDDTLSPNQRLFDYLLHVGRTYYSRNISEIPKSSITLEVIKGEELNSLYEFIEKNKEELLNDTSNIFQQLHTYNVNIVQEYVIDSIEDFISVSLVQILQNNVKICRCENCDKLFISINKANEKYCTYELKNGKSCRDLSYSIYLQKNELSNILRKKYRTENAKKNRNKHIPNIEKKFKDWYTKAKEKKIMCEQGEITKEEFKKWLEDNQEWF